MPPRLPQLQFARACIRRPWGRLLLPHLNAHSSRATPRLLSTWGSGLDSKLGHGDQTALTTPKSIELFDGVKIDDVVCGVSHTVALLRGASGGHLFSWGSNFYGQAGHIPESSGFLDDDDDDALPLPTRLKGPLSSTDVTALACGDFHTVALTHAGTVYTWGGGALGHGTEYHDSNAIAVGFFGELGRRGVRVAARGNTTAVLAVPVGDGSGSGSGNEQQPAELYAWGHLGAHTALSPVLISHVLQHPFMNNAAHIEAIAVGDGVVGIVGVEDTQQRRCLIFGTTPTTDPATGIKPPDYPETRPNPRLAEVWDAPPVADVLLDAVPVRKIACGADFGVALHEGGTLALFDIGREGAESREVLTDVADVALSPTSLLVLKRDGSIVAWGAAAAAAETSPPPESKPQMKTKWYWPFGSGSTSTGSDAGSGLHPRITAVRITGSPPRVVARMTGEPQATRVEAGWDHFAVW